MAKGEGHGAWSGETYLKKPCRGPGKRIVADCRGLTFSPAGSSFPHMNSLSSVTPQLLRRAADVQEHILKLQDELTSILRTITSPEAPEEPKREVSDAAKAKMRPAAPQVEKLVTSK